MAPSNGNGNGIVTQPLPYSGRQTTLQKLQVGSYGTEGDAAEWTYYDRIAIAAAVLTNRLFTNPVGAGGKTLADTNLQVAGQIPQAQNFEVSAIKIMYTAAPFSLIAGVPVLRNELSLYAINQLFDETTVAIKLSNKDNTGLWTLQELMGSAFQATVAPAAPTWGISQMQPKFHGIFPLNRKIVLAALTPFEVTVTHHVAPLSYVVGDHLRIGLSGILTRAT